jgi:hypothetical protein
MNNAENIIKLYMEYKKNHVDYDLEDVMKKALSIYYDKDLDDMYIHKKKCIVIAMFLKDIHILLKPAKKKSLFCCKKERIDIDEKIFYYFYKNKIPIFIKDLLYIYRNRVMINMINIRLIIINYQNYTFIFAFKSPYILKTLSFTFSKFKYLISSNIFFLSSCES